MMQEEDTTEYHHSCEGFTGRAEGLQPHVLHNPPISRDSSLPIHLAPTWGWEASQPYHGPTMNEYHPPFMYHHPPSPCLPRPADISQQAFGSWIRPSMEQRERLETTACVHPGPTDLTTWPPIYSNVPRPLIPACKFVCHECSKELNSEIELSAHFNHCEAQKYDDQVSHTLQEKVLQLIECKETLPCPQSTFDDTLKLSQPPGKRAVSKEKKNDDAKENALYMTIGKIRRYDAQIQKYGPWENITIPKNTSTIKQEATSTDSTNTTTHTIHLQRGGKLTFHSNILPPKRREAVLNDMKNCKLFRQYHHKRSGVSYPEPRLHVLLSSNVSGGYDDIQQLKDQREGISFKGANTTALKKNELEKNVSSFTSPSKNNDEASTLPYDEVICSFSSSKAHAQHSQSPAYDSTACVTPLHKPSQERRQSSCTLPCVQYNRENEIDHSLCSGGSAYRYGFSAFTAHGPLQASKQPFHAAQTVWQYHYNHPSENNVEGMRSVCQSEYDCQSDIHFGGTSQQKEISRMDDCPFVGNRVEKKDGEMSSLGTDISLRNVFTNRPEGAVVHDKYPCYDRLCDSREETKSSFESMSQMNDPLMEEGKHEYGSVANDIGEENVGGKKSSPQVDVTTSSSDVSPGYVYHMISMKAKPLSAVPEVESLANDLAAKFGIPDKVWNVGVNMIIYRDGHDNIGWHADDTQGESIILCVVVDSGENTRSVKVRPKKLKKQFHPINHGDEEIELRIRDGDGYVMDGDMQNGYEHSVPKMKKSKSNRFVIIFRQGMDKIVANDSGIAHPDLTPPSRIKKERVFDHPDKCIVEGRCLYPRCDLITTHSHGSDRRGVSGNKGTGCDAIIVSRQSADLREKDGLSWLLYTSNSKQGGGAMFRSFQKNLPIRVFRSSVLTSQYAPPTGYKNRTMYRYDGLYEVTTIWDERGAETKTSTPPGEIPYTFLLRRLPSRTELHITGPCIANGCTQKFVNGLTVEELWEEIMKSKGIDVSTQFIKQTIPSEIGPLFSKEMVPTANESTDGIWDIAEDLRSSRATKKCMKAECGRKAVAAWSSDLKPNEFWYTCEKCQEKDFGGWPDDDSPEKSSDERSLHEQKSRYTAESATPPVSEKTHCTQQRMAFTEKEAKKVVDYYIRQNLLVQSAGQTCHHPQPRQLPPEQHDSTAAASGKLDIPPLEKASWKRPIAGLFMSNDGKKASILPQNMGALVRCRENRSALVLKRHKNQQINGRKVGHKKEYPLSWKKQGLLLQKQMLLTTKRTSTKQQRKRIKKRKLDNASESIHVLLDPKKHKRFDHQPEKERDMLENSLRRCHVQTCGIVLLRHQQLTQAILAHRSAFFKFHRSRKEEVSRLALGVRDFFDKTEKKKKKDAERAERARLAALESNDMKAYKALVEKTKNKRLNYFLEKTRKCMDQILSLLQKRSLEDGEGPVFASPSDTGSNNVSAHLKIEEVHQPSIPVGGDLLKYQSAGLKWLIFLYSNKLNGILADEIGLGKDIQTISLLAYLMEVKNNLGPFLVIIPLSTMSDWVDKFTKWCPTACVLTYEGNPRQRQKVYREKVAIGHFNVLLTTHEYIIQDKSKLQKIPWEYAIIDAGHCMKDIQSKFAIIFGRQYMTKQHILLTGTPLKNNLSDLWALLNILLPTIFNSVETFEQWFSQSFVQFGLTSGVSTAAAVATRSRSKEAWVELLSNKERSLITDRLHELIRLFMLRRVTIDVLDQFLESVEQPKVITPVPSSRKGLLKKQTMNKQDRDSEKTDYINQVVLPIKILSNEAVSNKTQSKRTQISEQFYFVLDYNEKEKMIQIIPLQPCGTFCGRYKGHTKWKATVVEKPSYKPNADKSDLQQQWYKSMGIVTVPCRAWKVVSSKIVNKSADVAQESWAILE